MTPETPSSSEQVWSATQLAGDPHRVQDKADRVRAMFSGIAGSYDLNNRIHSMGRDQAWRRRTVAIAGVGPGDHVLDVACGTGDLTEALADAAPASVAGIDFAEPMLDLARAKARRRRRRAGAVVPAYRTGDAMALDVADASCDVVTIAFGLRNVAEPARALSEFHRVLRPTGRLVVLEFSQPRNPVLRRLSNLYTSRIMPITATALARDRSGAYRYLPRSVETFADGDSMRSMLEAAGFGSVSIHPMTFGICTAYRGVRPGPSAAAPAG